MILGKSCGTTTGAFWLAEVVGGFSRVGLWLRGLEKRAEEVA
jgi:hypothetical protein